MTTMTTMTTTTLNAHTVTSATTGLVYEVDFDSSIGSGWAAVRWTDADGVSQEAEGSAPGGYLLPVDIPAEDAGLIGSTVAWLASGSPRETSFDLAHGDDDGVELGFFMVRALGDETVEVSYPEREGDDPSDPRFFPTEEIEGWASMVFGRPLVCDGGSQDNDGKGRVTEIWQMASASHPW